MSSFLLKQTLNGWGEDLRKLYVALTRSRHYCYLGLAALKDASAISYLLTEQGQMIPGELAQQLSAFTTSGFAP